MAADDYYYLLFFAYAYMRPGGMAGEERTFRGSYAAVAAQFSFFNFHRKQITLDVYSLLSAP